MREMLHDLRNDNTLNNLIRANRTTLDQVLTLQSAAGRASTAATFNQMTHDADRALFRSLYGMSVEEMNDLSDRIVRRTYQERRRQVRPSQEPIVVPGYSATRHQQENLQVEWATEDTAFVGVEGGNTYVVTDETCTCPDFHFRVRVHPERHPEGCRHMQALRHAYGQTHQQEVQHEAVASVPVEQEETHSTPLVTVARTRPLFVASQMTSDVQREEILNTWRETRGWDGTWMQTDEAAYQRLMQEVENDFDVVTDGTALGGTGNMFGVEIELEFPQDAVTHDVTRELAQMGLIPPQHSTRQSYHTRAVQGHWIGTRDGSLRNGLELVSPILHDTPEHWEQIRQVLAVAKRHGATVSQRTGCHTNINLGPTDARSFAFQRLARAAAGHERILYRMGGADAEKYRATGEKGLHRGTGYISPMGKTIRIGENTSMNEIRRQISSNGHTSILNLANEGRIEFRYPNSTVDLQQMQAQIIVANAMVHQAAVIKKNMPQDSTTPKLSDLSQQLRHHDMYVRNSDLARPEFSEEQGFRRFLDFLGTPLERKAAAWLYRRGSV